MVDRNRMPLLIESYCDNEFPNCVSAQLDLHRDTDSIIVPVGRYCKVPQSLVVSKIIVDMPMEEKFLWKGWTDNAPMSMTFKLSNVGVQSNLQLIAHYRSNLLETCYCPKVIIGNGNPQVPNASLEMKVCMDDKEQVGAVLNRLHMKAILIYCARAMENDELESLIDGWNKVKSIGGQDTEYQLDVLNSDFILNKAISHLREAARTVFHDACDNFIFKLTTQTLTTTSSGKFILKETNVFDFVNNPPLTLKETMEACISCFQEWERHEQCDLMSRSLTESIMKNVISATSNRGTKRPHECLVWDMEDVEEACRTAVNDSSGGPVTISTG